MRILVSGASGFIGRNLLPRLDAAGIEASALTRREGEPGWDGWRDGADAVIHLGALNPSRNDPASRDRAALSQANAVATAALAEEAARRGVGRVVLASTALVHTPQGSRPFREDDPPRPQNAYAESKLEAERCLRGVLESTGTAFAILRLPPVYGPGGRGSIAALARLAALPVPLPLAGATDRRSVIGVANAAQALLLAATHPAAAGGTFLVADNAPLSLAELVRLMRRAAGRPAWLVPAPLGSLARVAGLAGTAEQLLGPFVVDDSAIRERLGWHAPVSTAEGLRATIRAGEVQAPRTFV